MFFTGSETKHILLKILEIQNEYSIPFAIILYVFQQMACLQFHPTTQNLLELIYGVR